MNETLPSVGYIIRHGCFDLSIFFPSLLSNHEFRCFGLHSRVWLH